MIRNCYRWKDSQTLLRPNEAFTPVHNARWPWRPFQVDSHPLEKRHCGRMWLLVKLGRLQQAMSCWSTHTKPRSFPTQSQTTIPNNKMAVKFILICFSVSKLCVYCLAIKIYILRFLASLCWKLFTGASHCVQCPQFDGFLNLTYKNNDQWTFSHVCYVITCCDRCLKVIQSVIIWVETFSILVIY